MYTFKNIYSKIYIFQKSSSILSAPTIYSYVAACPNIFVAKAQTAAPKFGFSSAIPTPVRMQSQRQVYHRDMFPMRGGAKCCL